MAGVDYERAWVALKAHVASKGSHGMRDLLVAMSEIEVECADSASVESALATVTARQQKNGRVREAATA